MVATFVATQQAAPWPGLVCVVTLSYTHCDLAQVEIHFISTPCVSAQTDQLISGTANTLRSVLKVTAGTSSRQTLAGRAQ